MHAMPMDSLDAEDGDFAADALNGMDEDATQLSDAPAAIAPSAPNIDAGPVAPVAAAAPALAPASTVKTASFGATHAAPAPAAAVATISIPVEAGPVALREAAGSGDAKALLEIGSRYADGRGVASDMEAAARWYEKSAELGFAPAQYRIGNFYEKGLGVQRDVEKAKTWYQLAAAQGNASAMHNLAVLFAMGADGTTDNQSATRWFMQAAELGVKDSQYNLGILAAKGVGMTQSLEESYKWFALVAKTGDKDAAAKRDEIANSLRPEQLERARAAAELWKPKPLDAMANSVEIPEAWQESPTTTASIDMKKAVRNIQAILNKNGYDAGSADGVLGEKTKTAIAAFQKDNDMEATGEVNEKVVRALLARK
jgi:localization factor PodJL